MKYYYELRQIIHVGDKCMAPNDKAIQKALPIRELVEEFMLSPEGPVRGLEEISEEESKNRPRWGAGYYMVDDGKVTRLRENWDSSG